MCGGIGTQACAYSVFLRECSQWGCFSGFVPKLYPDSTLERVLYNYSGVARPTNANDGCWKGVHSSLEVVAHCAMRVTKGSTWGTQEAEGEGELWAGALRVTSVGKEG